MSNEIITVSTSGPQKVVDISVWNDQVGSWFDLNEARDLSEARDKVARYAADELASSGKVGRYQIRETFEYEVEIQVVEADEPEAAVEATHGITAASLDLFLGLVEDAANWSGMPLVTVSASQKGNLTDLKRKGLVETMEDEDGCVFALFTEAGVALATEHGHDLDWIRASYDPSSKGVSA